MAVTFGRYLREWFWVKNRTLQEGFSSGERRSILAQDKGPQSQAPAARPQSPAVRGFPGFGNRSLRCTLRGVFAVLGERERRQTPVTADFSRWPFRSQSAKPPFSTAQKSDSKQDQFSVQIVHILRRCSQWKGFLAVRKSHRCNKRRTSPGSARFAPQ